MIALAMGTDIPSLSATFNLGSKQYSRVKTAPFYSSSAWRISSGGSIKHVDHCWGPFWSNRPFPILQYSQQLWEKMSSLCCMPQQWYVKWEWVILDIKFHGNMVSGSRHLKIHLLRVCLLLLPLHLFGGSYKIPLMIHATATQLGNSCSFSSPVMFAVSPLNGRDCGLLRVLVEKKVQKRIGRNQVVISHLINALKFSSYCDTI